VYRGIFDEDLWQDVREKKLVGLLAREMIESEPKWLNYEFEQAQVKIDTGDMILEALMGEAI
jgi:ribosomal protein L11 methylase PrmA